MSHRKRRRAFLLGSGVAILVAFTAMDAQQPAQSAKPPRIDAAALRNAGTTSDGFAGSWLSYGLTQGETRFSPLHQINAHNVSRLGLSWIHPIGAGGGNQEATPLVWNGTIYGITNWSVVFAVDARTGEERWRWIRKSTRTRCGLSSVAAS